MADEYNCSNCGTKVIRNGAYYKCHGCGDSGNINEPIQKQSKLEQSVQSKKQVETPLDFNTPKGRADFVKEFLALHNYKPT